MKESMFCFQCQETAKGTGCTVRGVCGKNSTTSARMDLLLFVIRGISIAAHTLRTCLLYTSIRDISIYKFPILFFNFLQEL